MFHDNCKIDFTTEMYHQINRIVFWKQASQLHQIISDKVDSVT